MLRGEGAGGVNYTPTEQDRERFDNQRAIVLKHLLSGQTLTSMQAQDLYGIARLAARISELRTEGWNIITNMIPVGSGKKPIAEYFIQLADPRRSSPFLPVDIEGIPDELKQLNQWLTWRAVTRGDKISKVPYAVGGRGKGKSNDPSTWGSFADALKTYEAGRVDGIGFVFAEGGGRVGVDFDGCFNEQGVINPKIAAIVEKLASYTEYSVSGRGLHVIVRGELAEGRRSGKLEIYPHGRYFTMTGCVYGDITEICDGQRVIKCLIRQIEAKAQREKEEKKAQAKQGTAAGGNRPYQGRRRYRNNAEILEVAMNAANSEKFRRLWSGDISGYKSNSEADLALLSILLFWLDGDEARADVLFRQSGLFRKKWEDRADYRRRCFDFLRGKGGASR